jgi:hypothetical protein
MTDKTKLDRIKTLEETLEAIADVYSYAPNGEGITGVEFLNQELDFKPLKPDRVKDLMKEVRFDGLTPIGKQLSKKVLQKYAKETMQRPLLVVIITDAEVRPHTLLGGRQY